MIVSDLGSHWQVVRQPDHARLCRHFAERWGNDEFRPPVTPEPLKIASERHDDGWAIWEQAPTQDPMTGKPLNFLDVAIPVHLTFWRAATATVSSQDPYAGVLVSLHGAGIYRNRYGMQVTIGFKHVGEVGDLIDIFVREQERMCADFLERYRVDEEEVWSNYRYLQVYDILSLYLSGQDLSNGLSSGQAGVLVSAPTGHGSTDLTVEPLGQNVYRLDPYPFADKDNTFTLVRRRVEKRHWRDDDEFRAGLRELPEEHLHLRLVS